MKKQHWLKIFHYASKRLWLLLIPLMRSLLLLRVPISEWIRGAWVDLSIIFFILGTAILRWYMTRYKIEDNCIVYNTGIIVRRHIKIPYTNLCSVYTVRNFFLRPIRVVTVHLDTNSGPASNSDFSIMVKKSENDLLLEKIYSKNKSAVKIHTSYKPSKFNLIFFSFAFSSTLSGAIFISTLIFESGQIVGESLEQRLIYTFDEITRKISLGLPPIAVGISLFIICAWLISFIRNLARYIKFRISRNGDSIKIHNGFFTKRHYYINVPKINYVNLRQNLLMKVFKVMSVQVSCSGYGKAKNELPVIIPITTKKQVISSLKLLLPSMKIASGGIKSSKVNFFKFIWLPVILLAVDGISVLVLVHFFHFWREIIIFLGIMIAIVSTWLLIVKLNALFTTGISYEKDNFTLRYSVLFNFHTILVPKDKIVKVKITQSIFQKCTKSCDVRIYTTNEFIKPHWIMALNLQETLDLMKSSGFSNECSSLD